MTDLINAIGLISGGLGIIGFLQDNIPKSESPQGTAVNIKVGIAQIGDSVDNLGGQISAVYGFNTFNEFIGQSGSQSIPDGDYKTFIVDQSSPGEQSSYVGIANGNDATCVSWITVEQRDSTQGGAWTGDIGAECGQRWHMGNQIAGKLPDSGENYIPRCTWLDSDFTDGTVSAALKFRISAYGETAEDTVVNSRQCSSTIFGRDEGPIAGEPAKRSVPERPAWILERLIVSSIARQTAEELCGSATSWGPDFIGVDGKFCDMTTKQIIPLCSTEDVDGCVEVSEDDLTVTRRSTIARRQVKAVHKSYKTVTHNRS